MLRETAFLVGGGMTVALGLALLIVLVVTGVGLVDLAGWLAAAAALVLGGFFFVVARDAHRYREEYLRAAEDGRDLPPGGAPP